MNFFASFRLVLRHSNKKEHFRLQNVWSGLKMAPAHFVLKKATQNQLCCKTALLASQPAHHVAQGIAAEKGNQGGAAIHKERPILHTSKGPLAMVEPQVLAGYCGGGGGDGGGVVFISGNDCNKQTI